MARRTAINDFYSFAVARWRLLIIAPLTAIGYANSVQKYFQLDGGSKWVDIVLTAVIAGTIANAAYLFGRHRCEENVRPGEGRKLSRRQLETLERQVAGCRRTLQYPPLATEIDSELIQQLYAIGALQKKLSKGFLKIIVLEIRRAERAIDLSIGRQDGVVEGVYLSVTCPSGRARVRIDRPDLANDCLRLRLPTLDVTEVSSNQFEFSFQTPTAEEVGRIFDREKFVADALLALEE